MRVDTDALGERIAEHVAHIDAAMHLLLTDIREFDKAGGWYRQGFQSCAHWLSWRVGWSLGTAREHVRVAGKLADLPQIDDALQQGKVSYSKVRAMTRVATPANESTLLEEAELTTGQQLETICRKYSTVQRHDRESNQKDDSERRYLQRRDQADGMVQIIAALHPEEAATVWAALERIIKEGHRRGESPAAAGASAEANDAGVIGAGTIDSHGIGDDARIAGTIATTTGTGVDATGTSHAEPSSADFDVTDWCASKNVKAIGINHAGEADRTSKTSKTDTADTTSNTNAADTTDTTGTTGFDRTATAATATANRVHATDNNLSASQRQSRVPAGTSAGRDSVRAKRFGRADALVLMAEEVIRGSRPNRSPIELVVTVAATSLLAPDPSTGAASSVRGADASARARSGASDDPTEAASFADGTAVSATVARRLACDAGFVSLVEDRDGAPLSVGRKTRTIPAAIKRALLRRDHGCRFPGCTNRMFVEGHHMQHWLDGGETKIGNMVSLCSYHHRFVHEYRYRVELIGKTDVRFIDPDGVPVRASPEPARPAQRGWETIRSRNTQLGITASTAACGWDGARIDLAACIDELVRAEDRHARCQSAVTLVTANTSTS